MAAAGSQKADPAEVLEKVERRLLAARDVTASCQIEATGAVAVAVKADLWLGSPKEHRLEVKGTFAGTSGEWGLDHKEPTSLLSMTHEGAPGSTNIIQTPQAMREALVYGFTRMGLLHNISRLLGGELPDHAEGGAAQWVETAGHRWEPSTPEGNPVIGFEIAVAGANTAAATMTFGPDGLPIERHQRVEFDSGTMEVVERCTWTAAPQP